jgi:hypothetical protein
VWLHAFLKGFGEGLFSFFQRFFWLGIFYFTLAYRIMTLMPIQAVMLPTGRLAFSHTKKYLRLPSSKLLASS